MPKPVKRTNSRAISKQIRTLENTKLTKVRPEGGGAFRSGAGEVLRVAEESQNLLDQVGTNVLDTTPDREALGVLQKLINKKTRNAESAASNRASVVARSDASQRETRAINSAVQSGRRRVRGASVALPRLLGTQRSSLLR